MNLIPATYPMSYDTFGRWNMPHPWQHVNVNPFRADNPNTNTEPKHPLSEPPRGEEMGGD